jgi:hypothetical protein
MIFQSMDSSLLLWVLMPRLIVLEHVLYWDMVEFKQIWCPLINFDPIRVVRVYDPYTFSVKYKSYSFSLFYPNIDKTRLYSKWHRAYLLQNHYQLGIFLAPSLLSPHGFTWWRSDTVLTVSERVSHGAWRRYDSATTRREEGKWEKKWGWKKERVKREEREGIWRGRVKFKNKEKDEEWDNLRVKKEIKLYLLEFLIVAPLLTPHM